MDKLMIEAVLFDIDNTLILFEENDFFNAYMNELTPKFLDIFTASQFQERLIGATRALLNNRGRMTNSDFYLDHFSRDMDHLKPDFWVRFNRFYDNEFNRLKTMVKVVNGAYQLLDTLHKRGLRLIAASNPLWPLSVQTLRLAWAGVDSLPYLWITHIENSTFCKPQPEFYLEISKKIGLKPEQCLMVGNDPLNDMIAGTTGMKTYLTTDSRNHGYSSFSLSSQIRNSSSQALPEPDFTGPLNRLMSIFDSPANNHKDIF
jgi:FMN phosphatase YigB (HAD superfamily)